MWIVCPAGHDELLEGGGAAARQRGALPLHCHLRKQAGAGASPSLCTACHWWQADTAAGSCGDTPASCRWLLTTASPSTYTQRKCERCGTGEDNEHHLLLNAVTWC
jgi:hypothetical protein